MHINSLQCYRECSVTCAILSKDPHQHKTCQATTELLLQCPPSTIFHTIIYSTLWALQLSRFPRSAFPVPEFPHSGPTTECAWILSFWFISQDLRQNSTPTIVKTQVFKQNLPKMLLETKRLWNQKSSHSWEKFENCQNRQTESWFCIIKCFLSKK